MNDAENPLERRRQTRTPIHLPALIKIGSNLYGKGSIKEISLGGMRIESAGIFKIIRPCQMADIPGMRVSIHTNAPSSISLQGVVVHTSPEKNEAGIAIIDSSDEKLWKKMAEPDGER